MAIIVTDSNLGIEVKKAYVKISSFNVNEGIPTEDGVKKYNVVVFLDFYPNDKKETIYRKQEMSVDGLYIEELNHAALYERVSANFAGSSEA